MIRQLNNQVNHFNNIEHLDMVDIHRFITEPMEMSSPMFLMVFLQKPVFRVRMVSHSRIGVRW